ncbi:MULTISPECIES: DMT family transporter [Nocardiaceae]|uniref:DME family drug/metabolite transporter n=1 Tax=Rhodococcoides corynebacterioides TaxID=53972 RepID=A0ABS2KZK1_9NOCA|nr:MULTISPECIES: DMT family transporter [Rhodococcus]MBM7417347.1 DME family drug/metabolite transporter [Rhodococcus corynebacterioides]MBP1115600.1 DME family drug/metabolite transporter [Rhodococcus sp. PvP016]
MIHSHTALSSIAISAQRLAIASLVLVVATASLGSVRSVGEAILAHPARIAMIGAGIAGYQTLWFVSITHVGSSTATVLSLGSATVLVTAWESWRARARPSTGRVVVVIAAVIGLVLVSSSAEHGDAGSGDRALGLGMATCSGVLYAVTTVLSTRMAGRVRPLALTTATTAIGAVFLFPIAASTGPVVTSDTTSLLALAYLGVVTMTLGYLLLYSGLRTAPASAAVVATLIEPATATVLAFLVLGDRLTVPAMVGVILILVSIGVLHLVGGSRAGPRWWRRRHTGAHHV